MFRRFAKELFASVVVANYALTPIGLTAVGGVALFKRHVGAVLGVAFLDRHCAAHHHELLHRQGSCCTWLDLLHLHLLYLHLL